MKSAPTVLMLQGPLGPLFGQIASDLMAAGSRVIRVQFSGNDVADWPHGEAVKFQAPIQDWPRFLHEEIAPLGVDVVLMHGDRRPYHKRAAAWAQTRNIDVLVTELGYFRPDWMTLEREGTAALTRFPQDPEAIRECAARCPDVDIEPVWQAHTWPVIVGELRFTIFNALYRNQFPEYQCHRNQPPLRVYSGWLAGRLRSLLRQNSERPKQPYFVFALQLEGDFQLRDHSPFQSIYECVDHVVASFATCARADATLILKPHPHEFGRRLLLASIHDARKKYCLGDRLAVVEGQSIRSLCEEATGFVTVNSSAGMEALSASCPVHTVMPTIYDVPGLTHQGKLDGFWTEPVAPDDDLFADFRKALCQSVQVRGTIYHPEGCRIAAKAMAERILEGSANTPNAFEDTPPRLTKALEAGVRYE